MGPLEELFNKAKTSQPPLSKEEAEGLILGAPTAALKTKKHWFKAKGWLFATIPALLVLVVLGVNVVLPAGDSRKTTEKSLKSVDRQQAAQAYSTPQSSPAGTNIPPVLNGKPMAPASHYTVKPNSQNAVSGKPGPKHTLNTGGTPPFQTGISDNETLDISESMDKQEGEIVAGDSPLADETVMANNNPYDTIIAAEKDSIPVIALTAPVDPDTAKKTITAYPAQLAPMRYRCGNFIRIDMLGFLYKANPLQAFYWEGEYSVKSLVGNRFMLGYEYMISRRFSVGGTISYGTALYTSGGGSGNASSGFSYLFESYKGFFMNLEGRYYAVKRPNGSGLYIGTYLGKAVMQERVFLIQGQPNNGRVTYNTISTSTGKSWGIGFHAGIKFMVGRFFIEPLAGFVLYGEDRKYFNQAIFGQESIQRWRVLQRAELSIGYSF